MSGLSTDLLKLFFTCISIQKEIEYCLSKQALRLGLSILELQVLWIIASSPEDLNIRNISIVTARPKEELQSVVESLEADGLVTRIRECGSRKGTAIVTLEGQKLIGKIFVCKAAKCLLKDIPKDMLSEFTNQACSLIKNFGANEVVENLSHCARLD